MKTVYTVYIAIFTWLACAGTMPAQDAVQAKPSRNSNSTCPWLSCSDSGLTSNFPATNAAVAPLFSLATDAGAPDSQSDRREIHGQPTTFRVSLGYDYLHFRSQLFTSNVHGLRSSFSYSWKEWLGVEGSVLAGFGSSTFNNQDSNIVLYGAGPRVTLKGRFQPWAHALAGGIHVYPQTAFNTNGFAVQLGGGVDYAYKPFLSIRVESDYVRSQLYSAGQNSFLVGGGIVIPF